ncbi:hypothetical protein BN1723_008948 [Verticillium longisporum]|uniref:AMP-dependent synthetase/ligase domain-containing protein n=1 Tax=Verticillium longisporum TaxID=100787 RepID=A0A0G4KKE3_VERLO|nr:hypothetical protein BN1723_008948 [Verticillium longisporum]
MSTIDITKDLAALFSIQAKATPDAVALEDEARTLTYAELDRETQALADHLRRQHGVGRDSLVGVLMNRSADYVVASLAALRAGGAFLVLELAYPSGLLRDVIEDAKPSVVITQNAHVGFIKADVPIFVIDESNDHLKNGSLRLETAGTGLRVTSIQPGNTATELLGMSTDAEAIKKYGEPTGAKVLDAEDVASSIVFAVCQPPHVAVNEVLIEPRDEPI